MDLMAGVEIKGDEAMIEALAQFSKRNASHVKGILNLTIPLDESPIWILGQFLSQLGLSTESRRPLEDGKRVRYYRFNTEDVVFAQEVLEYRQRQRDQREQKRQEEQQRNAAYAARMQAQYGIGTPSTPPLMELEIIIGGVWTQRQNSVILGGRGSNITLSWQLSGLSPGWNLLKNYSVH